MQMTVHSSTKPKQTITKQKEVFYLFLPKEKVSSGIFSPVFILLRQAFRQKRISPSLVDKVVTSYNVSLVDKETFKVTLGKSTQALTSYFGTISQNDLQNHQNPLGFSLLAPREWADPENLINPKEEEGLWNHCGERA